MSSLLSGIHSPDDLKKLNVTQLSALSEEIRAFLITSVSKTGGHLSSNLGTIDLTLAIHSAFSSPIDEIVWDVGHQCYTHKIVTGRKDLFDGLRKKGGISGFPRASESEHDIFIAGHGSTSISVAVGLATAKKLKGEQGKVIVVVGDGAFTGGMIYEGINNIKLLSNLIVVLNDNGMSISKNVGAVAQYLTKLRTAPIYFETKRKVQNVLDSIPVVGTPVRVWLQGVKSRMRQSMYHSTMFEDMGFQYVGPVDGHDIGEMIRLFSAYQSGQASPLFVHLVTKKGKGFEPAEENPGEFHGVSAFDPHHITEPDIAPDSSFSTVFGEELSQLAIQNTAMCAITAAMKYGTGLQYFYKCHKERFFDVGMAEQHAVTFAAGLAISGLQPVVAIYSTFLQRSYDQIIHDVCLQKANVLFAVDRAGFVPGDGETHQGIYDAAFLSEMNFMKVVSPCNYDELRVWLASLLMQTGPRALRYPRGAQSNALAKLGCTGADYDCCVKSEHAAYAIVTYGAQTEAVLEAAQLATKENIAVDVYKLTVIHPLPSGLAQKLTAYAHVIFAEEGIRRGGIGEHLGSELLTLGYQGKYHHMAIENTSLTHATVAELREMCGLDAQSIYNAMKEDMQ